MQKIQDWLTQRWVRATGRRINQDQHEWLFGPIGEVGGIGEKVIYQLAQSEGLVVQRNCSTEGLLTSIEDLCLVADDLRALPQSVVDFYEHTSQYELSLSVRWNYRFKVLGRLLRWLFSMRINQLVIPTGDTEESIPVTSEIITLWAPESQAPKHTFWLRRFKSSGQFIYSGVYGLCSLASGHVCVKVTFPLPNGNATVILKPSVSAQGELVLDSSGESFGDPGFYFILRDPKRQYWAHYVASFRDTLTVSESNGLLNAVQELKLGMFNVAHISYSLVKAGG